MIGRVRSLPEEFILHMFFGFSSHDAISRAGHHLIVWLLLGCVLLWGTGITISIPVAKDNSEAFPCQDHACGCRSARACWNDCCCFTPGQKLAWAARNRVAVPRYVSHVRLSSAESSLPVEDEFCAEHGDLLAPDVRDALYRLRGLAAAHNLRPANCEGNHAADQCADSESQPRTQRAGFSLSRQLGCRGVDLMTLFFSPIVPPAARVQSTLSQTSSRLLAETRLSPASWTSAPEPPPPRA